MKKIIKFVKTDWLVLLVLTLLTTFLFKDFIFKGLLPIPADFIVGSFHPWTDEIWQGRTLGYPVKNIEIGDIVYQLYPWKLFSIREFFRGQVPLWNPYNLTGTPHLANVFTASFYPFNFIFLFLPFSFAWGIYIFIQPFVVGLTTYLYLKNLKLKKEAAMLGGVVFAFSSILMLRLEFGMVGHAALWLPLSLLAADKLFEQKNLKWLILGVLALAANFLAGYLQVAIYSYLIYGVYCLYRGFQKNDFKTGLLALSAPCLAFLLCGAQSIPLLEAIVRSSRIGNYGRAQFFAQQFFLPWERLITFLVPDLFGNYATWNFWGKLNYYEFSGYLGIIPLFFFFYSLFSLRKKKDVLFWVLVALTSFLFLLPTPLALFPYKFKLPGFSVLVPSRIIFLIDFSLAILAALGLHQFLGDFPKQRKNRSFWAISFLIFMFAAIGIVLVRGMIFWPKWQENAVIIGRNLILPLLFLSVLFVSVIFYLSLENKKIRRLILTILFVTLSFGLVRQARKYNPFVEKEVVFPETKVIGFLREQKNKEAFRVQVINQNLFPSNFNLPYEIEFINGYDSFHSKRVRKLLAVANFEDIKADQSSFGRSIFSSNHRSPLFDLMNVKYVLSLDEVDHPKLKLVFQEGKTRVYENIQSYPRVYLTGNYETVADEEKILEKMFEFSRKGERKAIFEEEVDFPQIKPGKEVLGKAEIKSSTPQKVRVETESAKSAILVFSDAYDPGWKAFVDGEPTRLYRVNYNFRAIEVPAGDHQISFVYQPLSFKVGLFLSLGTGIFLLTTVKLKLLLFKSENKSYTFKHAREKDRQSRPQKTS